MQKRKYTHLKAVEGLILSMRQDGMTFQEIADELGLSHKQLRNWSYRHNCESRNMLKGIAPKPKGRPRKDGQPPKQDMERNCTGLEWRINCCGIFCSQQKGSETKGEVCRYPSSPRGVPNISYVQVFRGIPEWIL